MIDYIIEGIPSEVLRNQARMHSFSFVQDFLKAFRKIKLEVSDMTSRNEFIKSNKFTSLKKLTEENKSKIITRGVIKCYACNETGHYAKDCWERPVSARCDSTHPDSTQ